MFIQFEVIHKWYTRLFDNVAWLRNHLRISKMMRNVIVCEQKSMESPLFSLPIIGLMWKQALSIRSHMPRTWYLSMRKILVRLSQCQTETWDRMVCMILSWRGWLSLCLFSAIDDRNVTHESTSMRAQWEPECTFPFWFSLFVSNCSKM